MGIFDAAMSLFRRSPVYSPDDAKIKPGKPGDIVGTDYEIVSAGIHTPQDEGYNPDDLIGRLGNDVYKEMLTDGQVVRAVDEKKNAVLSSDWEVVPASDEQKDVDIAEYCAFVLDDMYGSVRGMVYGILDAVVYGNSVNELIWKTYGAGEYVGKWGLSKIKLQDPAEIKFKFNEYGMVESVWQRQPNGPDKELPLDKIIIYTYRPEYGRVWGRSDLRAAYKHYYSKNYLIKMWNYHLETFGSPTRKISYPATETNPTRLARIKETVRDIMTNTAVTHPDDLIIEFMKPERTDQFQKAIEYHDKQIHLSIMGQTLTGDEGQHGTQALGKIHGETKLDFIDFLREDIAEFITENVIRRIVSVNFDGVTALPYFNWIPKSQNVEITSPEDLKNLIETGIVLKKDFNQLRRRFDLPETDIFEDSDEILMLPSASAPAAPVPPGATKPGQAKQEEDTGDESEFALNKDAFTSTVSDNMRMFPAAERLGGVKYFKAQSKKLDEIEMAMVAETNPYFRQIKRGMIRQLSGKLDNDKAIENLSVPRKPYNEYRKVVSKSMATLFKSEYLDRLMNGGADTKGIPSVAQLKLNFSMGDPDAVTTYQYKLAIDWTPVPDEATQAQLDEYIENGDWQAAKELRTQLINDSAKSLERQFWITDVTDTIILKDVKQQIASGLFNGKSEAAIMKSVSDVFDQYIVTDGAKSGARIRTVVRNATTSAQADADLAAANDPELLEVFPYLTYMTVDDDRRSDICTRLHGLVYPANDPIWRRIKPPNHHNCRSFLVDTMRSEAPDGPSKPVNLNIIPKDFGGTK